MHLKLPLIFLTGAGLAMAAEPVRSSPSSSEITALEVEISTLETSIRQDRLTTSERKSALSDSEIAARTVQLESLAAKKRELSQLARQERAADKAERHQLQERLAAAKTPEERLEILERHVALQKALSETVERQSSAK